MNGWVNNELNDKRMKIRLIELIKWWTDTWKINRWMSVNNG